jgi:hypothetical protein
VPHSGKSSFAKTLVRLAETQGLDAVILPFAGPVKESSVAWLTSLGVSRYEAERCIYRDKNDQIPGMPPGVTGRKVVQRVGTDLGRRLHPGFWLERWLLQATAARGVGKIVIADDMRFMDEALAISSLSGERWKIDRQQAKDAAKDEVINHESEGGLELLDFDRVFANDGDNLRDLEDLLAWSLTTRPPICR